VLVYHVAIEKRRLQSWPFQLQRKLLDLLQNCEIARIPSLRDYVVLLADLAEHGMVDVHEVRS